MMYNYLTDSPASLQLSNQALVWKSVLEIEFNLKNSTEVFKEEQLTL